MGNSKLEGFLRVLEKAAIFPAYAIVVGWGVRSAFTSSYDTAALAIPMVLVLAILTEIRKQLREELPTRRVASFEQTQPFIRDEIEHLIRKNRDIEIRILGQSMASYIGFFRPYFAEIISKKRDLKMSLRMAMIDPNMEHLGPGLSDRASSAIKEIKVLEAECRHSRPSQRTVELHLYRSPPSITGICINDSCLFLGMIKYEKKRAGTSSEFEMAATAPASSRRADKAIVYEMVRAAGGSYDIYRETQPEDEERITLFIDSFDALCLRSTVVELRAR